MAGFVIGSLLVTWVVCGALNGLIEHAAIVHWISRGKAFLIMILGVMAIAAMMVILAVYALPRSDIGLDVLMPHQLSSTTKTSCLVNVLFAFGYCGFQLRRFWED